MSTPSQELENSNTCTASKLKTSSTESGTMSTLLQEIENYDARAASVLKKADFQTDSEIQTLTREDLNELFPGSDKQKLRKIFEIIQKQKPTQSLLEEPEGVSQPESLRDVVIAVCLKRINTKDQLDEDQAHVNRPEDLNKNLDSEKDAHFQTDSVIQTLTREGLQKLFPGPNYLKLRKTVFEILHNQHKATYLLLGESGAVSQQDHVKDDYLIRKQNMKDQLDKMQAVLEKGYLSDTKASVTTKKENHFFQFLWSRSQNLSVKYKMVVCGETFDAHLQLLDQIQTPDLNLMKGKDKESCITIVFCPVVSRSGTDAEAAMKQVPGDDPVLLVVMHYSQEPKHVSSSKVLSSYPNVLLEVNIFYHDKKKGLLKCQQNQNAVTELKKELKKYSKTQSSGSGKKNQSSNFPSS